MTKRTPPPVLKSMKPQSDGGPQREGAADKEMRDMQTLGYTGQAEVEGLDARLQAQIGLKLKAMYDELANEPIPDKFMDLLRKLDGQETGS
jgi:hypothetical protein